MKIRQRAIDAATDEVNQLRSKAKASDGASANDFFQQAARVSDELVTALCDDANNRDCATGRELRRNTLRDWMLLGQSRLRANDPSGAKLVAASILELKLEGDDDEFNIGATTILRTLESLAANTNPSQSTTDIPDKHTDSASTQPDKTPTQGGNEKSKGNEPVTKTISPSDRLAQANEQAEAGNWEKTRELVAAVDAKKLSDEEKNRHRAIASLTKVHDGAPAPDAVLDLLAGIDLATLDADSWLRTTIEADRNRALQQLMESGSDPSQNRDRASAILRHYPDHLDALIKLIQAEVALRNYNATTSLIPRAKSLAKDNPAKRLQLLMQEASVILGNEKSTPELLQRLVADAKSEMARSPGKFELFDIMVEIAASDRVSDTAFDQAVAAVETGRSGLSDANQRMLDSRLNTEASRLFKDAERSEKDGDVNGSAIRYQRARALHTKPPLNYLLALAKAASLSKPHQETAWQVYDELISEHFDELNDPYEFMLKSAQLLESTDQTTRALARYAQVAEYRDNRIHRSFYKQARVFFGDIIAPARRLAESVPSALSDAAVRKAVARIHGAQGILILDADWEDWGSLLSGKDPMEEALASLTSACDLYPDKDEVAAKFFTKLGFARKRLAKSRGKLDESTFNLIEKDALAALEAAPDYPGGHHLSADVLLDRAELDAGAGDYEEAKRRTNTSIEKLNDAAKGRENDPQAFSYFHNRSIARLMLAHYYVWGERAPNIEQVRALLERSVDDATTATNLRPEDPNGWAQLGNAAEDLAWSKIGKKAGGYPAACQAFERQIELSFDSPRAHANLGRCLTKWVLDESKDPPNWPRLDQADEHLAAALAKDPSQFEATYWMGTVRLLQDKLPEAIDSFADSITCPNGKQNWPRVMERVGAPKAAIALADLKAILDLAIPANPGPESAWLLMQRSGTMLKMAALDNAYKKDFDAAFALVDDKRMRAELYNDSIMMNRWARDEAKRKQQNDKADAFQRQASQHMEELVSMYMGDGAVEMRPIARLSEWAQLLANELVARDDRRKAVEVMDVAIRAAPENRKEMLQRIQNQIRANLRQQ
jgi:hypothetical protein